MITIDVVFFAACVALGFAALEPEPRIIGGEDAIEGQFPYQVSLRTVKNNKHFCGGSIISKRNILTAAHCTVGIEPSNIHAVVGTLRESSGGSIVKLKKIIRHPEWDEIIVKNDIAMIHTVSEIVFSSNVQPIALPQYNIPEDVSAKVIVSGWGYVEVRSCQVTLTCRIL